MRPTNSAAPAPADRRAIVDRVEAELRADPLLRGVAQLAAIYDQAARAQVATF